MAEMRHINTLAQKPTVNSCNNGKLIHDNNYCTHIPRTNFLILERHAGHASRLGSFCQLPVAFMMSPTDLSETYKMKQISHITAKPP